jgi:hypothetical protein
VLTLSLAFGGTLPSASSLALPQPATRSTTPTRANGAAEAQTDVTASSLDERLRKLEFKTDLHAVATAAVMLGLTSATLLSIVRLHTALQLATTERDSLLRRVTLLEDGGIDTRKLEAAERRLNRLQNAFAELMRRHGHRLAHLGNFGPARVARPPR